MSTLGMRLNNPLNIRYSPMNNWKGQSGECSGFCVFENIDYGFRAALILLRNYVRKGYRSVGTIIHRWAPKSENDTEKYIDYVVQRGAPVFINDLPDLIILCKYMAYFESGTIVDTDYLVDIAVSYGIDL